jgi:nucleoside-diphosphate-sugar epimerase
LAAEQWTIGLPERIDAVVHLAQSPHFREFPDHAADIYGVATAATMRLLDWARRAGARHFVLASTGGLYGSSDRPVRETDALPDMRTQLGFYFAAKRASELLAMQYAGIFAVVVLRCFFVYGPGQAPAMLIPRLIASVREGRAVQLQGEAGIRINPIHVSDAVNAIERALQLGESRTFNIAGPEPVTLRTMTTMIGDLVGREPVYAVDLTMPTNNLVADIARMSGALGAPVVGMQSGLAELCRTQP